MKKSKHKGKLAKSGVALGAKYASPSSTHGAQKRKGKRNQKKMAKG